MTGQPNPGMGTQTEDRYKSYEADDGSVVLYDGRNDRAWVRSDTTVQNRQ